MPGATFTLVGHERSTAYARVAAYVRDAIASGAYPPGAQLPTQQALAQLCGVSRITVVRALQELEAEGLVVRRQGLGTFVAAVERRLVLTSASQLYKQTFPDDGHPRHTLLGVPSVDDVVDDAVRAVMRGRPCWHVTRLRVRGERSVSYEETYLPVDVVPPDVDVARLEHRLVHDFLTVDCGVVLASTRVHVAATTLDPDRARALDRPELEPGLLITRVNLGVGDRAVSYSLNVLPADVSEYFFEFRHAAADGDSA